MAYDLDVGIKLLTSCTAVAGVNAVAKLYSLTSNMNAMVDVVMRIIFECVVPLNIIFCVLQRYILCDD